MTLIGWFLGCWAMLLIGPDTAIGHLLHRIMVALPCRLLSRITRGQVLLVLLLLVCIVATIALLADDGRMLVAMGLPEAMGVATAIDLSALLDLAAVAVMASGTVRLRALRHRIAARTTRPTPRRRRPRIVRPDTPATNDDDRPAAPLPRARAA